MSTRFKALIEGVMGTPPYNMEREDKPLVLVFPFGFLSHYLRMIVLTRSLRKRFTIRFATNPAYHSFLKAENIPVFNCEDLDTGKVWQGAKEFDFSWINMPDLQKIFEAQVAVLERMRPALVLGDQSLTLKMAAEKTGVPYISVNNAYMSKHLASKRRISRRHPMYSTIRKLPGRIGELLTSAGESYTFQQIHKPFRQIRERYGLKRTRTYLDELEGDHTLLCDLPDLFPQSSLPSYYSFTPPLFYEPLHPPGELLLELDPGKKTILVSMGSTGEWEGVRFLDHPHFSQYNIITTGDRRKILNAPWIHALDFADARLLLPRTDLVISHGGNGTLYQVLHYKVPLLCRTSLFEQEWNVEALERLGLGASLDGKDRLTEQIALVEEWMERKTSLRFPEWDQERDDLVQIMQGLIYGNSIHRREERAVPWR